MEYEEKNRIGLIRERQCRWAKLSADRFPITLDFDEESMESLDSFCPQHTQYAVLFRSAIFLRRILDILNRSHCVNSIFLFMASESVGDTAISWEYSSKIKCFAHTEISNAELAFLLENGQSFGSVVCMYSPAYYKRHLSFSQTDQNPLMVLTDREMEVLLLIAEGATNRTIADVLVISENTAKTHVRRILEKLQLTSRTKAALYAKERGLMH